MQDLSCSITLSDMYLCGCPCMPARDIGYIGKSSIHMWPDLPKRVLCTCSFKSHFAMPFDWYNNRLTVHAYTIAKGSMSILLLRPHSQACLASMGAWMVCKWLQLAWSGRQPAGNHHRTGWWDWASSSYILWCVEMKTAWIDAIWPCIRRACHFVVPNHPPPSTPIRLLVVSTTLWNKLSKMVNISTSYPLKSPSTEWSWMTID